jgi:hypothetical protein
MPSGSIPAGNAGYSGAYGSTGYGQGQGYGSTSGRARNLLCQCDGYLASQSIEAGFRACGRR